MRLSESLRKELDRMVNAQFETPEFERFLSIRYTMDRARFLAIEMAMYVRNRRDCWAFVQGKSPFDVKRVIWRHEGEELMSDPRCDTDHYTLQIKECRLLGIPPERVTEAEPTAQSRAAFYAWTHLAMTQEWLAGLASSSILERRNNNEIVSGGGLSFRVAEKWRQELGLDSKSMPSTEVHKQADKDHSDMLWAVFERYVTDERAYALALAGARESLEIDRAFRLALAVAMENIQRRDRDQAGGELTLEELDRELAKKNLVGFWSGNIVGFEQNIEPRSAVLPYLWRWADIYGGLMKAREVVSLEMSERRTVRLSNPGLPEPGFASPTIHMSVQPVRPGEIARAHRHTITAIRFVVKGSGAFTTVEGERFLMSPGDLILTPNWTWHDHYNASGTDILWLDGHDGPLTKALEVIAVEMFPHKQQPVEAMPDSSLFRYGAARPYERGGPEFADPPFKYPWEETSRALQALASSEGDPYDGALLRYANARTGGPTLRTIGCEIQMLRPGEKTRAHRHTSGAIYHAFRGAGRTVVGETTLEWGEGDCFSVPSWQWHRHENRVAEEAVLFSLNDRPLKEALGFYREETRPE